MKRLAVIAIGWFVLCGLTSERLVELEIKNDSCYDVSYVIGCVEHNYKGKGRVPKFSTTSLYLKPGTYRFYGNAEGRTFTWTRKLKTDTTYRIFTKNLVEARERGSQLLAVKAAA